MSILSLLLDYFLRQRPQQQQQAAQGSDIGKYLSSYGPEGAENKFPQADIINYYQSTRQPLPEGVGVKMKSPMSGAYQPAPLYLGGGVATPEQVLAQGKTQMMQDYGPAKVAGWGTAEMTPARKSELAEMETRQKNILSAQSQMQKENDIREFTNKATIDILRYGQIDGKDVDAAQARSAAVDMAGGNPPKGLKFRDTQNVPAELIEYKAWLEDPKNKGKYYGDYLKYKADLNVPRVTFKEKMMEKLWPSLTLDQQQQIMGASPKGEVTEATILTVAANPMLDPELAKKLAPIVTDIISRATGKKETGKKEVPKGQVMTELPPGAVKTGRKSKAGRDVYVVKQPDGTELFYEDLRSGK